jgi:tellurite resistance protein
MTSPSNQDLYQAAIAAFSLVSYADGQVHMSELSQLLKIFKEEGLFKDVTAGQLQEDITSVVRILNRDLDKKHPPVLLATIAKIKGDARSSELIVKIARQTLLADGHIAPSEQKILADIHHALGVTVL